MIAKDETDLLASSADEEDDLDDDVVDDALLSGCVVGGCSCISRSGVTVAAESLTLVPTPETACPAAALHAVSV